MANSNRNILFALSAVLLVLLVAGLVQMWRNGGKSSYVPARDVHVPREDFEMVEDDGYKRAPSLEGAAPKCGVREGEMYGYKYQLPEEAPSVESLMPEESACDSYYDPEASQLTPYVFTYPLTGSIVKTRAEQAGDMLRGDLQIPARDPSCDFKSIWNNGDQLLHGAFSEYTKKAHELISCDNDEVWVRNTPIHVANEELIQDYE